MYNDKKDLLPKECHIAHYGRVSNNEKRISRGEVARIMQSKMRQHLADDIVHKKMETEEGEFHTDYRLDLYVFSPSEFWSIVRRLAQEYAYDRPVFIFDGEVS